MKVRLPGQGLHVPVILVLHVSVLHVTYTYISRISNGTGEIWVKQLDRSVFILSGCLMYGNLDKKFLIGDIGETRNQK